MVWVLDLVPIAILLFFAALFAVRGFLKSVLSFGKTFISVIVTYIFGKPVSRLLESRVFSTKITDFIYDKLSGLYDSAAETFDLSVVFDKLNNNFSWVKSFGVDIGKLEEQYGNMTGASADNLREISITIATPVARVVSNVCAYLGLFVVALLICFILSFVLTGLSDLIDKIPVVGKMNHVLGLIFGIITGIIVVVLAVFLTDVVLGYVSVVNESFDYQALLDRTTMFRFIKNLNLIELLKTR